MDSLDASALFCNYIKLRINSIRYICLWFKLKRKSESLISYQVLTVMLFCLEIVRLLLQIFKNGFLCDSATDIPDASYVATALKAATFVSTMCSIVVKFMIINVKKM